ncbi:2-halobenzoate 1,2-dioxygenase large subunit (plasmid) [Variovorax sp. SRS16]|uniref:aromatic ring-hydroxylating oxygenase subunit alpha n=1 Tax=Variovorax sp. SRS16 TaxID=282217 RepID=UPI0013165256|nr:aromatic ring-hydroxylating dioxygenase subunit alpha [Variovorax sp. SRS16]VTU45949.1 2-halobenzoate 1,2-dioxygenase large subunit [Variovorax sp. SRS16]
MRQEQTARILHGAERTAEPLNRAAHSPREIYFSPDVFALEREHVFFKDWVCCGRIEALVQPGDYLSVDIVGEPLVITRTQEGRLAAFSNVCLHRAVAVAPPGQGNRRAFSCPFHGWTYDLEGRLMGAPRMQGAECFEKQNFRLPAIQVDEWHGWVFVNLDPQAAPLSEHTATLERDFAFMRQDDCRLAITTVNDIDCNWKLVVENVIDLYHVNLVHKSTNGRQFTSEAFEFAPRSEGGYYATFNSGPSTLTGQPVFGRMPWLQDLPESFAATGRLRPNFTLFARIDTVHALTIWPLSPTRTRVTVYTLLPKQYFDAPDFAQRVVAYQDYQNKVISEDREVLQMMQRGLSSHLYVPGRMAEIEAGVHHIEKDNLARLCGVLSRPEQR